MLFATTTCRPTRTRPPVPTSTLSSRLVLPMTAALGVGIAVGWLLPHPVQEVQETQRPTAAVVQARPQRQAVEIAQPLPVVENNTVAATPPTSQPAQRPATAQRGLVSGTRQPAPAATPQPLAAEASVPDSTTSLVAQTAVAPAPLLAAPVDSAPASPLALPAPAEPIAADSAPVSEQPLARAAKPSGTSEKIAYRKLSQRQPERGTGVRRWFSHLFQSIRHLLG
jgi:hypothetical protein